MNYLMKILFRIKLFKEEYRFLLKCILELTEVAIKYILTLIPLLLLCYILLILF